MPLVPEHYRINKPIEPKPKGTFRVVCLGDSSTIGDGVEANETYCDNLEKILSEKLAPTPVETINAGFYGYTSYQGELLFAKYADTLAPDATIFYFGANDAVFAPVREDKNWENVPHWALQTNHFISSHSHFYRFFRNVNIRYILQAMVHPFNKSARKIHYKPRVSMEDFFLNLNSVRKITAEYGGKAYIVPYLSLNGDSALVQATYFDRYQNQRLIDLFPVFQRILENGGTPFVDGIHPNPNGHRIIAEMLAEKILLDFPPNPQN